MCQQGRLAAESTAERDTRLEQAFSMKGKQLKVATAERDTRLEQAFSIKG